MIDCNWRIAFHAGKWEWLSDAPSLLPPCEGAISYYSQFGRVPGFTTGAGRRFRPILDEHLELLLWPDGIKVNPWLRPVLSSLPRTVRSDCSMPAGGSWDGDQRRRWTAVPLDPALLLPAPQGPGAGGAGLCHPVPDLWHRPAPCAAHGAASAKGRGPPSLPRPARSESESWQWIG